MKFKNFLLSLVLLFFSASVFSQSKLDQFLTPSDSLNVQKRNIVIVSEAVVSLSTLSCLSVLWYNNYPKSNFHFINDNTEWLQMDKGGHLFSSYHIGRFGNEALRWSGVSNKNQLVYGATLGFLFLSAVEVLDGYSSNWGASTGDIAGNALGTTLFVSQELLWKEQRIIPKFSFHNTIYASVRPTTFGSSYQEQIIKDYNGQTYWLSFNLNSFTKSTRIPKWINIALGYGAEGMITGNEAFVNTIFLPESKRYRQFYLSLDMDLTKINTKSHFLKTFLSIVNTLKIPAPTFEINSVGDMKFHYLYF